VQKRTAPGGNLERQLNAMILNNAEALELDERLWRAWIEKNEKRDKVKLARLVKVITILVALFALGILVQNAAG
jgi:hypothetical protein